MKFIALTLVLVSNVAFASPVLIAKLKDVDLLSKTLDPSPDSKSILVGQREVVDLATMKRKVLPNGWHFSWMPQGKRLIMLRRGGPTQIGIFDTEKETYQVIDIPSGPFKSFADTFSISKDESKLAFCLDAQRLQLLDFKTNEYKTLLTLSGSEIYALPHFTEDPKILAVDIYPRHYGARNGKLYNLETSESINYPKEQMNYVGSTGSAFFFSGYFNRNIFYFDRSAREFKTLLVENVSEKNRTKIEISTNQKHIKLKNSFFSSPYNQVIIDLNTGASKSIPNASMTTPDFRYVANTSIEGDKVRVRYSDLTNGNSFSIETENTWWGHGDTRGFETYVTPDSKKLIFGVGSYIVLDALGITTMNVLDFETNSLRKIDVGDTIIEHVKFSPDSKYLFYSGSRWGDLDYYEVYMEKL